MDKENVIILVLKSCFRPEIARIFPKGKKLMLFSL